MTPQDETADDDTCTSCGGFGTDYQTERRCACQPPIMTADEVVERAFRAGYEAAQRDEKKPAYSIGMDPAGDAWEDEASALIPPGNDEKLNRRQWAERIADQFSVDDPAAVDAIEEGVQRGASLAALNSSPSFNTGVVKRIARGLEYTADAEANGCCAITLREAAKAIRALSDQSPSHGAPE